MPNGNGNGHELEEDQEPIAQERPEGWRGPATPEYVTVELGGRGASTRAEVGAPFEATIRRIADEANYGQHFRVYIGDGPDAQEIVGPEEAPAVITPDMRISMSPYDKVGR